MPTSPVVLVTGATAGIGRALALAFGNAGYAVGICARTASAVQVLVAELEARGLRVAGLPADVGDPDDVAALVGHVTATLGPIDVLVNNAGIGRIKRFEDLSLEDWDAVQRTNVRSLFLMTRAVLPAMRARGHGTVVNICSSSGRVGFVGGTAYAASKHAVLGFSRSLLLETRKEGIRVVAICPGSVDTAFFDDQDLLHPDPDRVLQPEDVAETVLAAVRLPGRALVSELDIRPANP